MPSLNEIVGILSERAGRTFDIPFQEELKSLVLITGTKFMKDSLTKRPQDRKYYLQSVVLPIIRLHKIECPIKYGCTLRTEDKVPAPLRVNGILFDFVGSADLTIPYAQGGDWKETYFESNRYTADNKRYTYRDNYIFISDKEQSLDYIGIIYIPSDLSSLKGLKCDGSNCIDDDTQSLIAGDLIEPIISSILTKLAMIPKEKTEVEVNKNE